MASTTPIHGFRIPDSGDPAPALATYWVNLGNDIDAQAPVASPTVPSAPVPGLIWENTTNGVSQWWDGSGWRLMLPPYTYSGTPIAGAVYNPAAPVQTKVARVNQTTDTNGLLSYSLPGGLVSLLDSTLHVDVNSNVWRAGAIRYDLCTTSSVVFQIHDGMSGGAALVSTPVIATIRIEYQ